MLLTSHEMQDWEFAMGQQMLRIVPADPRWIYEDVLRKFSIQTICIFEKIDIYFRYQTCYLFLYL
jgi:hypothetical protein